MNKKLKNIFIGAAVPTLSLPLALTAIVSCSNEAHVYDGLAYRLKIDAIEEFVGNLLDIKGITSVHRPTFHTKEICEYLAGDHGFDNGRIQEIMGEEVKVWQDDYSSDFEDTGHNLYFDIPANDPDMAPIIIQCHTDMIWSTELGFPEDHPLPQRVKIDGREALISQSKAETHKKSSLGADNGIGIGLCLALARNRSAFKHGKIRILMTTDEERGVSGAEHVPHDEADITKNWFCDASTNEYIPYLINIDLEDTLKTATSCGGTQESSWFKDNIQLVGVGDKKLYELTIKGLTGGYSPRGIVDGKQNAIKMAYSFLHQLNTTPGITDKVQIAKSTSFVEGDPKINTANIPDEAHIWFYCDDLNTIQDAWVLIGTIREDFYNAYKYNGIEPNLEILLEEQNRTDLTTNEDEVLALSGGNDNSDTNRLIDFVLNLPYGAKPDTNFNTSYNLGGVRINDTSSECGADEIKVQIMGRSSLPDDLGHDPDKGYSDGFYQLFKDISHSAYEEHSVADGEWSNEGWTPLWKHRDDNLINETLMTGAKSLGLKLQSYDEMGWFEVSYFDLHTDNKLHMGDLGFDIKNPHTINEVLYLDTMEYTIKLLLYAIQHAPKISIPFEGINTRKEGQYE